MMLSSCVIMAQDIDNNDISFGYYQLPLTPLNKSIKNYQSTINQKFEDVIKTKTEFYNQELAKAEEEYKKGIDAAAYLQKLEDDKFAAAMVIWNKKPLAEQIANPQLKPQRTIIPLPTKREVPAPDLPKTYDTKLLAGKYLVLQGFTNSPGNEVKISVDLFGFNSEPPVVQSKVTQKATEATPTTPARPEIKKYFYVIKYKHMMSFKMEADGIGVITEQFPQELDNYKTFNTAEYDSVSILEKNWPMNKAKVMEQLQDKSVYENLEYISNLINDKYGIMKKTYGTELSVVDEKKGYQDYKEAYVAAENAYKEIGNSVNKASAMGELNKAIGLWEAAMKESQPNNKKARVDGGVTEITILNLIEAYIWKDDYINAKAYIDKLKTLDPGRKARRRMERMEILFKDNKARFEANQGM